MDQPAQKKWRIHFMWQGAMVILPLALLFLLVAPITLIAQRSSMLWDGPAPLADRATNRLSSASDDDLRPDVPDLSQQLSAIEPLLPSLYLGMELFPSLPKLIGLHEPQRYLLVVQNSDELRATGGFISALGLLTLENGRVADLEFVDSYRLYRADQEYPPAPAPLADYMGIPYLLFRDANWSPDFPTTAALLQVLYRQETGVSVDGIVTVDLHAVEAIIGALAPLQVPNSPEPLTGANVIAQVKAMWTQPDEGQTITDVGLGAWWGQRKDFIPTLAAAVVAKLQSGGIDYVAVAVAVEQALNERSIQIWLADKDAAFQLARLGWDGSLQVLPNADYLGLIDTNMGYKQSQRRDSTVAELHGDLAGGRSGTRSNSDD